MSSSTCKTEVRVCRSPSLLVKAGEVPAHDASSTTTPLYQALTPAAQPPLEPLPASFAPVARPPLHQMWTGTARPFPELDNRPSSLLRPDPSPRPPCIKYLELRGQRQWRESGKRCPIVLPTRTDFYYYTLAKEARFNKRSTCSTWLERGRTPRGPRGNLTISWDNTTSTIRGNHCRSTAVHALFERCRRPA